MSKRRGRKRKTNARRRMSPSRRPPDNGTPELQRKRLESIPHGADPALSTSYIDQLFAREAITDAQRKAAWRYTVLYWSEFGKPHTSSQGAVLTGDTGGSSVLDMERAAQIRQYFEAADLALLDAGKEARRAVRAACLDECSSMSKALLDGLDALAGHFGYR